MPSVPRSGEPALLVPACARRDGERPLLSASVARRRGARDHRILRPAGRIARAWGSAYAPEEAWPPYGASGRGMEPTAEARREAALEIQKLAEDFEQEDEAAFRRTRLGCWVVAVIVTVFILGLIALGGDARYLGIFWLIIVGLIWAGYGLSSRRQRQQIDRLRALAARWLSAGPSAGHAAGPAARARSPDRGQRHCPASLARRPTAT